MTVATHNALTQSSGDLLADRRFAYAEILAENGDHLAAAELLSQTLDLVPSWIPAWMALGAAWIGCGRDDGAERAYGRAADLDSADVYGAALHLSRFRRAASVPVMPEAYVAALFDDYALRFDRHLTETLAYVGPAVIIDALGSAGAPAAFITALDLGCGTGLMGRAIRARTTHLHGVDLSPGMVAEAARTGLYDSLVVSDIDSALADQAAVSLDLVLAADVFAYVGRLDPLLVKVARALASGGILAFTVQRGSDPVRLGHDIRFSHSEAYLREALLAAGLDILRLTPASTRRDGGEPVPGLVVIARKP